MREGGTANKDRFQPYPEVLWRGSIRATWEYLLDIGVARELYLGKDYHDVAERHNIPEGMAFTAKWRVRNTEPEQLLEELLAADSRRLARQVG